MQRLAAYTFGLLKQPWGHPDVAGFVDAAPAIFEKLREADGVLEVRETIHLTPKWVSESARPLVASTLTVWRSPEDLFAFTYWAEHGNGYQKRREWFQEDDHPGFVLWWLQDGEEASEREGLRRLELLHDRGPTPEAFTFKAPYSPSGEPLESVATTRRKTTAGALSPV